MVIVVSGVICIGKTTVCQQVVERITKLGFTCGGILTHKAPDDSLLVENIQTGQRQTLASTNHIYDGPRTAKYYFNPKGISFGLRAVDKGSSLNLLVVDELGHLEVRGEGFAGIFGQIRAGNVENSLLVIRSDMLTALLPQLPPEPQIHEVTLGNRNGLAQEICAKLIKDLELDTRDERA